jgi:hypothetical protein
VGGGGLWGGVPIIEYPMQKPARTRPKIMI